MGMGMSHGDQSSMVTRDTAIGKIQVNKYAADDMVGFVNSMHESGVPGLNRFAGTFADRKKRGGSTWSEHAFGNAIDFQSGGPGSGRFGVGNPEMMAWAKQNPQKWRDMLSKHHMYSGERFGDPGHFEWSPARGAASHDDAASHYEDVTKGSTGGWSSGKSSWFTDRSTASGISAANRVGIATMEGDKGRGGLGEMYEVHDPKTGKTFHWPKIDVGPHPRTGRKIDLSGPAAKELGHDPTDRVLEFRRMKQEMEKPITPTVNAPHFQQSRGIRGHPTRRWERQAQDRHDRWNSAANIGMA
jgi:hypothetical protein